MVACEIPLHSNAWLHRFQISIRILVSLSTRPSAVLWACWDRRVSAYHPGALLLRVHIRLGHINTDLWTNWHRQETFPALTFVLIGSSKRWCAYVSSDHVFAQILRHFALRCLLAMAFEHWWHLYCGQQRGRISLHSWLSSIVLLALRPAFRWRAFLLFGGGVLGLHALLRRLLLLLLVRSFAVTTGAWRLF